MTRHIIDKPRPGNGALRTRAYLRIARQGMPRSASRILQERPNLAGSGRLRRFLRIDRGIRV